MPVSVSSQSRFLNFPLSQSRLSLESSSLSLVSVSVYQILKSLNSLNETFETLKSLEKCLRLLKFSKSQRHYIDKWPTFIVVISLKRFSSASEQRIETRRRQRDECVTCAGSRFAGMIINNGKTTFLYIQLIFFLLVHYHDETTYITKSTYTKNGWIAVFGANHSDKDT